MKRTEMSRTMSRSDSKFYAAAQNHESNMSKLRHERRAETQRLDGMKKALQSKLDASEQISRIQAA
jgi:hypothetical protein